MSDDIRWKQRFENFERAYLFLKKSVELGKYDDLQRAGLIQAFEFTFELGWKTAKDYLESMGLTPAFPRQVIKEAFAARVITDGHVWLKMLDKRNELSHTYNDTQANNAVEIVRKEYFPPIQQLYQTLKKINESSCTD